LINILRYNFCPFYTIFCRCEFLSYDVVCITPSAILTSLLSHTSSSSSFKTHSYSALKLDIESNKSNKNSKDNNNKYNMPLFVSSESASSERNHFMIKTKDSEWDNIYYFLIVVFLIVKISLKCEILWKFMNNNTINVII
jgi:hypothetical protein